MRKKNYGKTSIDIPPFLPQGTHDTRNTHDIGAATCACQRREGGGAVCATHAVRGTDNGSARRRRLGGGGKAPVSTVTARGPPWPVWWTLAPRPVKKVLLFGIAMCSPSILPSADDRGDHRDWLESQSRSCGRQNPTHENKT